MPKKKPNKTTQTVKEKKNKKCRHCGRPETESFSLWQDSDPFIQKFQFQKELKFGELVACHLCESLFIKLRDPRYVENKNTVSLDFISNDKLKGLEEWESRNLSTTPKQQKVLKKIQATPPDCYTNGSEYIQFPCKCILKDGRVLEMCILQFRRTPPDIHNEGEIIYLDQVKEILESDYTLPPKVRYATTRAQEMANGFAPTVVKLPTGGNYVFSWTRHFFASTKIKGKDIKTFLEEYPYGVKNASEKEMGKILDIPIYYIYAHWDSNLLKFEIKGS